MLYVLFAVLVILLMLYMMQVVISIDFVRSSESIRVTVAVTTFYGLVKIKSAIPHFKIAFENGKPLLKYKTETANRKKNRLLSKAARKSGIHDRKSLYKTYKENKKRVMTLLDYLIKNTRITRFILKMNIGMEDAAATALLNGAAWAFAGSVTAYASSRIRICEPKIVVTPAFGTVRLGIDFNCIISIKLGHIINVGIRAMPVLLAGMANK